jgi:hypothetical protein
MNKDIYDEEIPEVLQLLLSVACSCLRPVMARSMSSFHSRILSAEQTTVSRSRIQSAKQTTSVHNRTLFATTLEGP